MPLSINKMDLKLKQQVITSAISRMSLNEISKEMDRLGWGAILVTELAGYLKRANGLVIQHPNTTKAQLRDKFLRDLEQLVYLKCPKSIIEIQKATKQLQIAEDGYRRILSSTAATDWYILAPEQRASAVLQCAARLFGETITSIVKQFSTNENVNFGTPVYRIEGGRPIDVEAPGQEIMSGLAGTLMMIAYQENWFQNDNIILPQLPILSDADTQKAGSPISLNSHWTAWKSMEERARFLGPDMEALDKHQFPAGAPQSCETAYKYAPSEFQWYNHVADWRTNDKMREYRTRANLDNIERMVLPLDAKRSLAPKNFISENEILGYVELNNRLGMKIEHNNRLIGGLKVIEWLRGYAVLSELAKRRFNNEKEYLQIWTVKELEKSLHMGGIQSGKAKKFITNATFGKNRSDFYDSPLLALHDGGIMLIVPCAMDSNPAPIVISVFARLGFQIDGGPFEDRVLELFNENNIPVHNFSFKVNGEQYQYDAVVNWENQIFLFECKNRSLPGKKAVPAYYFEKSLSDNQQQIIRLRDGLLAAPDELNKRFGEGTSQKPITMVILSNQSYSRFSNENEVHFYDFSALQRFFQSPNLNMQYGKMSGPFAEMPHTKLWNATEPTSNDLLEQLKNPAQLKIIQFHTKVAPVGFMLDEKTAAFSQAVLREEQTMESMKSWRDKQF